MASEKTTKALSPKQEAADKKLDEWYAALAEKPALEAEIQRLETVIAEAEKSKDETVEKLDDWQNKAAEIRQELDQLLNEIEQEGLS